MFTSRSKANGTSSSLLLSTPPPSHITLMSDYTSSLLRSTQARLAV